MAIFNGWDVALLRSMGLPVTPQNRLFLQKWQMAEGGTAANNPLNTTQGAQGATNYNSVGVKNFRDPNQGLQATIQTLRNGHYPAILAALQSGNPGWSPALGQNLSVWGTGSGWMQGFKSGSPTNQVAGSQPAQPSANPSKGSPPDVGDFRSMLAATLLQNAGDHHNLGASGLLSLAVARQQQQAAQQTFGNGAGPQQPLQSGVGASTGASTGQPGFMPNVKGMVNGLQEAFYDPLGQWDNGRFSSQGIGNHSDHVHLSINNPQGMISAITMAQRMGLHVGENPYVGGMNPSVHVPTSFHKRMFPGKYNGRQLGEAIDVSGSAAQMAAFYRWATGTHR